MEFLVLEDADVSHILTITAHPDDIDFGAAGTVATWIDAGIQVTYCIVTDGQAGGSDRTVSRTDMVDIRRAEQIAAAAEVGVHDVRFLGYVDGELTVTHELRRDISRVIRQVRPDRVLIQSPERNWERIGASHPDHLAAGEAAISAIFPDARNPFAHMTLLDDEGLEPWTVRETWLMATASANHFVDVTATLDRKLAALASHRSQMADFERISGFVRGFLTANAERAGLAPGRLAEAFQVVSTA